MSGRYAYTQGQAAGVITNGHPVDMPLSYRTLPKVLKDGAITEAHMMGKWDCGMTYNASTPTGRGFDTFLGYYDADQDYFTKHDGAGYVNTSVKPPQHVSCDALDFHNDSLVDGFQALEDTSYSTYIYRAHEVALLRRPRSGPVLHVMATQAVHGPLEAPMSEIYPFCNDTIKPDAGKPMNESVENRRTFCGMLRAVDTAVGAVLDEIEARNATEDWLVWFTADNGGQAHVGGSNQGLRGNKATLFEGGVRASSAIWWSGPSKILPDERRGTISNELYHVVDILPTLAHVVGAPVPDDLDGLNIWDSLQDPSIPSPHDSLLVELIPGQRPPPANTSSISSPNDLISGSVILRMPEDHSLAKLIYGWPNCSQATEQPEPIDPCPSGWITQLGYEEPPPPNPSYIWLFNITQDPEERINLYPQRMELFNRTLAVLNQYIAKNITQSNAPFDPASCPKNRGSDVWQPWRPDPTEPL